MKNNVCENCGAPLTEGSRFCHLCGAGVGRQGTAAAGGYSYHYEYHAPAYHGGKWRHLPLSCMLAYVPGLFWLPLLTDIKNPRNRACANQGLWLTITFFLFGALLYMGRGFLYDIGAFDIARVVGLFQEWAMTGWQEKITIIVGIQIVMAFMFYVPVNGLCAFFHGMGSDRPYILPVFGHIRLIGRKDHAEGTGKAT